MGRTTGEPARCLRGCAARIGEPGWCTIACTAGGGDDGRWITGRIAGDGEAVPGLARTTLTVPARASLAGKPDGATDTMPTCCEPFQRTGVIARFSVGAEKQLEDLVEDVLPGSRLGASLEAWAGVDVYGVADDDAEVEASPDCRDVAEALLAC
mmetsp:Transcript_134080/g.244586  ORF Transcript_134080/g.244586 Transcript_134080/m.244586 type:complete len:154 (-) Transcript_134080:203-664(-)